MPTISALSSANAISNGDYIVVVTNPTTLAETKRITYADFMANVAAISVNSFIITNNATPSNSSITITRGKIFFDSDYLYLAVANNMIKRVALNTF